MNRKLSKTLKNKAIRLRLRGRSYNEIRRILGIASKGTLSCWFKDLELPFNAKKRLENNIEFARKHGLFAFNDRRTKAINIENAQIRSMAFKKVPKLSYKNLFLIGIALYWGEGYQSEKNKKALYVSFVNSNPFMITLFLRFLREILKIKDEKIKAHIRIHPNIHQEQAVKFWHKVTRLPCDRFRITRQISSASKLKRPPHSLPHGTIDIRMNDRRLFFKMKGYLDGLAFQSDAREDSNLVLTAPKRIAKI